MPPFDKQVLAKRLEALRLARVDSSMEGLQALPEDAAALDAFARGEIQEGEFMRRVSVKYRPSSAQHHRRRT